MRKPNGWLLPYIANLKGNTSALYRESLVPLDVFRLQQTTHNKTALHTTRKLSKPILSNRKTLNNWTAYHITPKKRFFFFFHYESPIKRKWDRRAELVMQWRTQSTLSPLTMYIVHTILIYNNFHSLSEIIYSFKHANTADQDFGRTYSSTYIAINYSNLKIKNKNKKNKNKNTKNPIRRLHYLAKPHILL